MNQSCIRKSCIFIIGTYNVSTTLHGKRDTKKVKRKRKLVEKRVLNNYLHHLYEKFMSENIEIPCSFLTFARMRPNNFVLANFANRKTCLCTQHQNLALKLKMLKKYKPVPTNHEAFAKFTDEKIISILGSINEKSFTFNIWKKVDTVNKGTKLKMKMILQTHPYLQLKDILMKGVHSFCSHVNRVYK